MHAWGGRRGRGAAGVLGDPRAVRRRVSAGGTGSAGGYIAGDWDSPALAALLDLAARNSPEATLFGRLRFPKEFTDRIDHRPRRNTKRGTRRYTPPHPDLGNVFCSLGFEASRHYSSRPLDARRRHLRPATSPL